MILNHEQKVTLVFITLFYHFQMSLYFWKYNHAFLCEIMSDIKNIVNILFTRIYIVIQLQYLEIMLMFRGKGM